MPISSPIPLNTLHKGRIDTYSAASRGGRNPTIAIADCFMFTPSNQHSDGTRISTLPSWHCVDAQAAAQSIAAGWHSDLVRDDPPDHVISDTLAKSITDSPHPTLPCPTVCFKPDPSRTSSRSQDAVWCLSLQRNAVQGEAVSENRNGCIVLSIDNTVTRLEAIGSYLQDEPLFMGSTWSLSKMAEDRFPQPINYARPFRAFVKPCLREVSALGSVRFREIPGQSEAPPPPSTTGKSSCSTWRLS